MPSKQTHDDDVIAIEELVHEIKQNLRLKAAAPAEVAEQVEVHPLLSPPAAPQIQNEIHHNNPPSTSLQPAVSQQQQQPHHQHHHHQLVIKKQRSRPSPYHIPCRSWNDNSTTGKVTRGVMSRAAAKSCKDNDENNIEDPYELLQSLLKNNSLVAEAVRRIKITNSYSRKQNNYFYYDSDEERSPIVMMCQLES